MGDRLTRFVLSRHGRVADSSRYWGRMCVPLSKVGIEDSFRLSEALATLEIEQIFTGPQVRASQTAAILSERLGLKARVDYRLEAKDYGKYSGKTKGWVSAQRGFYEDIEVKWNWRPPGGESFQDMIPRLAAFLIDMVLETNTVGLIVTHEDVVKVLVYLLTGSRRSLERSTDYSDFIVFQQLPTPQEVALRMVSNTYREERKR